jgi:sarcosine oxidase subunit beta
MPKGADVVVVGAGCTGASAAFWLASQHHRKVVLLDRATVGGGPTGRSSGIVRMHYSYDPLIRLARRSLAVFENFDTVVGGTADFRRTGFLMVVPPGEEATLAANVRLQQGLGVETSVVGREAVAEIDARLRIDDIGAGAFEPASGHADGYATATAFAVAARRAGADVREGMPALRILVEGPRAVGVDTPAGRISAGAVLVAGGPWTRGLVSPLGLDLPIRATRHQVVIMEVPESTPPLRPVFVDIGLGFYTRPDVGGQFLVGSVEEGPDEEVDADAFNEGMDFAFAERTGRHLVHRLPAFASAGVKDGYASLYDVTPDWQPILGAVPGTDGLYIAAGFSGHGFKLSPAVGEALASLIVTGRCDLADLRPFRPARFAEGDLMHSPYAHGIVG